MSSCTAIHIGELAGKCEPLSSVCSELDSPGSMLPWALHASETFFSPWWCQSPSAPWVQGTGLLHLVPDGTARAGALVVVDLCLHLPVAVLCLAGVPAGPQGRGQARQGPDGGALEPCCRVSVALRQRRGLPPLPVVLVVM
jgi:hypothetical protein